MKSSGSCWPNGAARTWLLLAVVSLGMAALCAVVLALARAGGGGLSPALAELFAPALVVHVDLAAVVWPLALACGMWTWLAAPAHRLAWPVAALAAASIAVLVASAAGAPATAAILSNYVPLLDTPPYLAALICFSIAVLIALAQAIGRWRRLLAAPVLNEPARWAAFAAVLPTALAFAGLAWGAWAADAQQPLPQRVERLLWGPGHLLQFTIVALLAAAWLWLLRDRPLPRRVVLFALALTVLPALAALPIMFTFEFGSAQQRAAFTELMRWGSWPGPLLLIGLAAVFRPAARSRVSGAGLAVIASMVLFLFGLVLGALIDGPTTTVPAHYHATLGAMTLSLLACLLHWQAGVVHRWLALGFATGAGLLAAGLALAGAHGAPRKALALGAETMVRAGMSIMGVGALLMIAIVLGCCAVLIVADWRRRRAESARRPDRRGRAVLATAAGTLFVGALLVVAGIGADSRSPTTDEHGQQAQVRVRFNQGVVMLHAKQYEHALAAFHHLLRLAPEMPEAHVNMGFALLGLQRHKEAADFFASAIELRKEQMNAYYGLAMALDALGDRPGAMGAMRTYAHRAPEDEPFRRRALAALWEWETQLAQAASESGKPRSGPRR